MSDVELFDPQCRLCPRLADFLSSVKQQYPEYHALPVAPFGDEKPRLLIVGLAPGMHGANASGRPFTGDHAGIILYQTLYDFGYSSQAESISRDDGLRLYDCRITNAVKCLPPNNKPSGNEINQCNRYLATEIQNLPDQAVILVLGRIAHQAVLKTYRLKLSAFPFGHAKRFLLPDDKTLVSSYHCSRYNIQTKRLNKAMLDEVFEMIQAIHATHGNHATTRK